MSKSKSKYSIEIDYKLSEDVAIDQFLPFLKFYEIDIDSKDPEVKAATEKVFDQIILYIRSGRLSFQGETFTQHLKDSEELEKLEYSKIEGKHHYAVESEKHKDQALELVGAMTGVGLDAAKKLKAVDLSVALTMGSLFLS